MASETASTSTNHSASLPTANPTRRPVRRLLPASSNAQRRQRGSMSSNDPVLAETASKDTSNTRSQTRQQQLATSKLAKSGARRAFVEAKHRIHKPKIPEDRKRPLAPLRIMLARVRLDMRADEEEAWAVAVTAAAAHQGEEDATLSAELLSLTDVGNGGDDEHLKISGALDGPAEQAATDTEMSDESGLDALHAWTHFDCDNEMQDVATSGPAHDEPTTAALSSNAQAPQR